MDDRTFVELEARLADLGAAIAFPATPPLAAAVAERLRRPAAPRRWSFGRSLAIALAATLLLAGIAAAFGIVVGGLRLTFGPASFSPGPSFRVGPGLGVATTLADARAAAGFTVRVPTLSALGEPDSVYLFEPPSGGVVTLLYGSRPGIPSDPETGIGLIITQFRGDIGPEVFEKMINSGVTLDATRVNGLPGWWVAGGEHFFFFRDANGKVVESTLRSAGPTLIWEEDGVTTRVEGAGSLAEALRVAASLRASATSSPGG